MNQTKQSMEKSGNLNLGTPGIMAGGAISGIAGAYFYSGLTETINPVVSVLVTLLSCIIGSLLVTLIYCFLTITLKTNQNVTGLALTTFGVGVSNFIGSLINSKMGGTGIAAFPEIGKAYRASLPFAEKIGWFGDIFLSYGFMTYLAIIIAIIVAFVITKTKSGLNLRAVGENPATADAAGINVTAYKYVAILVGSAIAGLGGFYYIMGYIGGNWEMASTIEAFGWLAIALVIFVLWKPTVAILGAFLFGACYIVAFVIPNITSTQTEIIKMLPYVITIVVLVLTSIRKKREHQPPAWLGLPYFREER